MAPALDEFAAAGENVTLHPTVLVFGAEHVELGSNVRIDAHCVITAGPGKVRIGDYVHLGVAAHVFGGAGVELESFSGLSSRVSIFSSSDDYVEGHLTNPTVPDEFRKVDGRPVRVGRHVILGCGAVILPGVTLAEGAAVGALTVVNKDVGPYQVMVGTPMRAVATRDETRLRTLEQELLGRPSAA